MPTSPVAEQSEHLWRLVGVTLDGGAVSEYECELCDETLLSPPADPPATV